MSGIYDDYVEKLERGFEDIDGYLCTNCVNNEYLRNWITEHSIGEYECKYCGEVHPCVSLNMFAQKIIDYIRFYYEDVNNGTIYYDNETGEWLGTTYDYQDIMDEVIGLLRAEPDEELVTDLDRAFMFDNIIWCDKDAYTTSYSDALRYSWKSFSDTVKYKSRYMFFNQQHDEDCYSPLDILDEIAKDLIHNNLYTKISTDMPIYRGRGFKTKEEIRTNIEELVSPKSPIPSANRMSAEGISAFYGAFEKSVALIEVANKHNSYAVCAEFNATNELTCLDLTKISNMPVPDAFDIENADLLQKNLCLKELYNQLTKPFQDYKNIEYVPVQVFAEYCKFVLKVDGIIYGSSKVADGKCLVLFFDHDQCIGTNDVCLPKEPKLSLINADTYDVSIDFKFIKK